MSEPTLRLLRKDDAGRDPARRPVTDETTGEGGRRLVCGACGHPVTTEAWRTSVGGGHEHQRSNPHGLTFHFGCFREAPGAEPVGPASTFFTWFSGYAWQISNCRSCGIHLGWRFNGESGCFFGLILSRLVADESGSASIH